MYKYSFVFFMLLLFSATACAQKQDQAKAIDPVYSTKAGAIEGYDAVAYFSEGKPVKGESDITFSWQNATWHFASETNRDLFAAQPEKYAPLYGGYCAYGWSQGYPVKIDPTAWSIVDGKLYLNYDAKVQTLWNEKQEAYIKTADINWAKALKKE